MASESFRRVTVVERDELPVDVADRRGVPQGKHLHGLLPRGQKILDELFDGFSAGLVDGGAVVGDGLGEAHWIVGGQRFRQQPLGETVLLLSRALVEAHVRTAVRALPAVTVAERCEVLRPLGSAERVVGVRVRGSDGEERDERADLVIDATGRGSRIPLWLDELGFAKPAEDRVRVDIGGVVAALEGGQHIATLFGLLGEHPPTDPDGFLRFAADLPFPDVRDALAGATLMSAPIGARFPASVRRRYEHLRAFPAGLLVIGDAICSFNPIYGQGMTVAAMQVQVLRRLLRRGRVPGHREYFRSVARCLDVPWQMAVGADLANPRVEGPRPLRVRMVNAYLTRLQAAARTDASLGAAFVRVPGLMAVRRASCVRTGWPGCCGRVGAARTRPRRPHLRGPLPAADAPLAPRARGQPGL